MDPKSAAPVVSARRLEKTYGPQTLFSDVALTVRSGERVGLLGANGAGKSTLLRVLAGLEAPDAGTVEVRRGARILYLAQEPALDDAATPRQIVESGLVDWHAATRRHAELSRLLTAADGATATELLDEQAELAEAIERMGGFRR